MPQPNTVMITLSHYRLKAFFFRAKKKNICASIMRKCTVSSSVTKNWLPWTNLSSKSSNLEKNAAKTTWQTLRWFMHTKEKFFWKERELGATKAPHTTLPTLAYTSFSTAWITANSDHQLHPSFPWVWWPTHLHRRLMSQRQIPLSKGRVSLYPQLIARELFLELCIVFST